LRPLWIGTIGFLSITAYFIGGWALPELGIPPVLTIGFLIILALGALRLLRWASGEGAWSDVSRLALASGTLTFFILLTFIAKSSTDRADNPAGMALVGLAGAISLLALNLRVRRRTRDEKRVEVIR
jgi:peptidoglycan/LPS O-acetylase OafA/YrhL